MESFVRRFNQFDGSIEADGNIQNYQSNCKQTEVCFSRVSRLGQVGKPAMVFPKLETDMFVNAIQCPGVAPTKVEFWSKLS